jgi:EAL domain-containing protein (putative c-di-GMP-specific phosphodiesterase class I)
MSNNVTPFAAPITTDAARQHQGEKIPGTIAELFHTPRSAGTNTPPNTEPQSGLALTPADVWRAICDNQVRVHYQPQYHLKTGEMVAAEALVRLLDGNDQLIYPDRFIEIAEQSDLIVVLGRKIIEQVCTDLATCRRQGLALQRIAINVSAQQLNVDTLLPDFIEEAVGRHGLLYSDLEFELTERQEVTQDSQARIVLSKLAARGARIVIDDIGVGYSSVAYLMLDDVSISAIKLDCELVRDLPENKRKQCLVQSLLSLAASLGLEVVAEGVETAAQNDYLASVGCPHAQGFGYAKPMSIIDLQNFIAEDEGRNRKRSL